MGKQTKLALYIAPFLILGGYILSDLYLENQVKNQVIALKVVDHCDVLNNGCVLQAGELKINITDNAGQTNINATLPLDRVTLMLVAADDKVTPVVMAMQDNPYYWQRATELRQLIPNAGDNHRLRIIAQYKGASYISEFVTSTTNKL
ncbi:hypothetical protein QX776_07455 [Alteromonadaceae bacterium BrNp21-10]|nr:hypothetical protein [Alteromonadaceae bacterium BrNp21-10]